MHIPVRNRWEGLIKMYTLKKRPNKQVIGKINLTNSFPASYLHPPNLQVLGVVWIFRENSGRMEGIKYENFQNGM